MIITDVVKINPLTPERDRIARCAHVLRVGGLVAFPTETVYGLGANLLNKEALERLYEVKKRPKNKPFTIHIAQKERADEYAKDIPPLAYKFMDKFWPGPLTVILRGKKEDVVGLRMPKNLIALNLIEQAGVPVVVPSANLAGEKPPVSSQDVLKSFNSLIDIIIDGGKVELGIESTIIDFTQADFKIVREGAIKKDQVEKIARTKNILFVCTGNSCRSVMAEALFKKMMQKRPDIEISSAGVAASVGMGPSQSTVELLQNEGIDVSTHLSRTLSDEMVKKSDLVLVMERQHQDAINKRTPQAKSRVYLLKEFASLDQKEVNIPDPVGKPIEVYRDVFSVIKNALDRIKDLI